MSVRARMFPCQPPSGPESGSFTCRIAQASTLPKTIVSTARLEEVLSYEPSVVNDPKAIPAAGDTDSDIVFDGVSFGYAGAAKDAVSDINVMVGRGMTTAIIGPTGSGKSTLVQMIPRFFDPTSGTVMFRGADSIVVMDKGRVVMQGTHEELLELCGLYREIFETQSYGEGE